MYIDFNQMKQEIDSFVEQGNTRLRAENLWLESKGVGRLEKRQELDKEVEHFVITSPEYWDYVQLLRRYFTWRYNVTRNG